MHEVCERHHKFGMLAAALDATSAATVITDGHAVLFANAEARRLFKCSDPAQIEGRLVTEVVHPDGHGAMVQRGQVLLNSSISLRSLPVKLIALDGTYFSLVVTATPVEYEGKRVVIFVAED